eukprot:TRINITY_DN2566_c0_g2_i1.p1 TRINITY_DN2566_c0_g2~~TRINITY_DN2566_c0_g2_i1.p1  ORF type:complete len:155 (+),score=56.04 TRINITY_DN2566_c0_g2_i1:171-635(+)
MTEDAVDGNPQPEAEKKVFAFDEVSKHATEKDCWLIIGGKVYDVTEFLDEHPGGADVMLASTAKDATNDFEDIGHSKGAREQLKQYYLGEVDLSTIPEKGLSSQPLFNSTTRRRDERSPLVKLLQVLLPLLILLLAIAVRFLTKREAAESSGSQ